LKGNEQQKQYFFSKHQGIFFSGMSLIVKQSTFIRFIINNFAKIYLSFFLFFDSKFTLFLLFLVLDENLAKNVVLEGRCSGVFFSKINIIIFEQF